MSTIFADKYFLQKFQALLRFQVSLLIFLWLGTLTVGGQTLVVKDRITHQPIEFVQVYWVSQDSSSSISYFTDPIGRVELARFVGTDTIRLRKLGYLDLAITLAEILLAEAEQMISLTQPGGGSDAG